MVSQVKEALIVKSRQELLLHFDDKELEKCFFNFLVAHIEHIYEYFGVHSQFISISNEESARVLYFGIRRDWGEE